MLRRPRSKRFTSVVGIFFGAIVLSGTTPRALAQSVSGFSFGQLDWYDPNQVLLVQDSSWGYLQMNVSPHATDIYYFNLAGNAGFGDAWLVQNLPVMPASVSTTSRLGVDFDIVDLGIAQGVNLTSMTYTWSLTSGVQGAPPVTNPSSAPTVATIQRKASGGMIGTSPSALDIGRPAGHKGPARVATDVIEHKNVPEVQEADNKCLAGAFARSLAWLNKEYKLGHNRDAQQIYDDLRALGVTGPRSGSPGYLAQIRAKHGYFRTMHNGATTKILDPGNIINLAGVNDPGLSKVPNAAGIDIADWIRQELSTEDVELHYGGHIVTIVGMYKKNNKIYVRYRDDETQGPDNTTINNIGDKDIKDAELVKVGATYRFRRDNVNFKIELVISESVPPAIPTVSEWGMIIMTLLLLTGGTIIIARRRPLRSVVA